MISSLNYLKSMKTLKDSDIGLDMKFLDNTLKLRK